VGLPQAGLKSHFVLVMSDRVLGGVLERIKSYAAAALPECITRAHCVSHALARREREI
jgi:hypothetical protein